MDRRRIVAIGAFFASMFAAGDSPLGGVGHAQDQRPPGRQLAPTGRPLHVNDGDAGILAATISGPEFAASSLFLGVEDPTSPVVKRLRTEYRLDDVVEGESNEFRKMLKLRHWVHSR